MRLTLRLPITLTSTALLLALPASLLLLHPRRSATGLERLLPAAALLQSFPALPAQAPPPLWGQRLGPALAGRLWPAQRHLWWQFWGSHADAGAYLVLSAPASLPLPRHGLRVDDLLVIAPDPLARQLLQEQLRVRRRPPRGLSQRCIQTLRQRQAVHWTPAAIAEMLGPLAPFAQELEQGCLVLSSQRSTLDWQGEADASEGTLAPAPAPLAVPAFQPLPATQLLELRGRRLDLLLRGPLSSPLLRQSLAQTYGLEASALQQLQSSPFELRLQPLERGPFRAGLELQVHTGSGPARIERWFSGLTEALRDQGLIDATPLPGLTSWSREDGTVVGGWRWLPGRTQLLLFLGPVPSRSPASPSLGEADWRLRLRPVDMARASLLPAMLPPVVRRSSQLVLVGRPAGERAGERQSSLAGRLDLR